MYLIAEIGVNHDGSLDTAFDMIRAASAFADCVKFQHFDAAALGEPHLACYELGVGGLSETKAYAESLGLDWLCTPFGPDELCDLIDMGCTALKLSSREVTHPEMLSLAVDSGLGLYVSLGMATMDEVLAADDILFDARKRTTLMHCVTSYPVPPSQANLRQITELKRFGYRVGYSDHTPSELAPMLALALGAEVLERHFTLDRAADGPDHHMSTEPETFHRIAASLSLAETILGSGERVIQPCEVGYRESYR